LFPSHDHRGDGFEIGISARHSGMYEQIKLDAGFWNGQLGLVFNGNRL